MKVFAISVMESNQNTWHVTGQIMENVFAYVVFFLSLLSLIKVNNDVKNQLWTMTEELQEEK